jgi:hypothetical protein
MKYFKEISEKALNDKIHYRFFIEALCRNPENIGEFFYRLPPNYVPMDKESSETFERISDTELMSRVPSWPGGRAPRAHVSEEYEYLEKSPKINRLSNGKMDTGLYYHRTLLFTLPQTVAYALNSELQKTISKKRMEILDEFIQTLPDKEKESIEKLLEYYRGCLKGKYAAGEWRELPYEEKAAWIYNYAKMAIGDMPKKIRDKALNTLARADEFYERELESRVNKELLLTEARRDMKRYEELLKSYKSRLLRLNKQDIEQKAIERALYETSKVISPELRKKEEQVFGNLGEPTLEYEGVAEPTELYKNPEKAKKYGKAMLNGIPIPIEVAQHIEKSLRPWTIPTSAINDTELANIKAGAKKLGEKITEKIDYDNFVEGLRAYCHGNYGRDHMSYTKLGEAREIDIEQLQRKLKKDEHLYVAAHRFYNVLPTDIAKRIGERPIKEIVYYEFRAGTENPFTPNEDYERFSDRGGRYVGSFAVVNGDKIIYGSELENFSREKIAQLQTKLSEKGMNLEPDRNAIYAAIGRGEDPNQLFVVQKATCQFK